MHIRITSGFHQGFLWLHPIRAYFTIFQVATGTLSLKSHHKWCTSVDDARATSARQTHFHFHSAQGFASRRLAHMQHSFVRVARRVVWDRIGANDLSTHRDCVVTPTPPSVGTASSPHQSDALVGPEPRPEELGHLPHMAPGAPETAADWSTWECSGGRRAVPTSRRS